MGIRALEGIRPREGAASNVDRRMVGPELRKTAFFPKGRQYALGRETQLVFS
jgi:hypothetical protein